MIDLRVFVRRGTGRVSRTDGYDRTQIPLAADDAGRLEDGSDTSRATGASQPATSSTGTCSVTNDDEAKREEASIAWAEVYVDVADRVWGGSGERDRD